MAEVKNKKRKVERETVEREREERIGGDRERKREKWGGGGVIKDRVRERE